MHVQLDIVRMTQFNQRYPGVLVAAEADHQDQDHQVVKHQVQAVAGGDVAVA